MSTTAQLDALRRGEPARIVGIDVAVFEVDAGPDARTGLSARVNRGDETYEVGLADLAFARDSQLGIVVAAYRRWQGREPHDQYLATLFQPRVAAPSGAICTHCWPRSSKPAERSPSRPDASRASSRSGCDCRGEDRYVRVPPASAGRR
jgi:hypothetical protein